MNLSLHFEEKYMSGYVDVHAHVKATGTRSLKLDTRNIIVHSVSLLDNTALPFEMGKVHAAFGSALVIQLPWEMRVNPPHLTPHLQLPQCYATNAITLCAYRIPLSLLDHQLFLSTLAINLSSGLDMKLLEETIVLLFSG